MTTALRKAKPQRTAASRDLKPHEHFRKFLQEGQYRITPERFDVLDAVLAWNDHFDADNLFIYLKNNGSKVSRATVYKTLALLHECGLVSRYRFSQGHAQYEKTTDRPHHDHMVCTTCRKMLAHSMDFLRCTILFRSLASASNAAPVTQDGQVTIAPAIMPEQWITRR